MLDFGGWLFLLVILRGLVVVVGFVLLIVCLVVLLTHKKKPKPIQRFEGSFGDNLKKLREARDLSVEDLAEQLQLSVSVITRFEQGTLEPHVVDIVKMADFFETSCDELLREPSVEKEEETSEDE